MPIALPRVANTTSDIPAMLALPAKLRPDTTATVGTSPDSSAIPSNVPTSWAIAWPPNEPGAAQALGPGPATVGEAHERPAVADRQVHDPVDLGVVDAGLRAAPHRVVVGQIEPSRRTPCQPGDQTTGRLVLGAGEHAGLDERAGVDDGIDALPRGQPAALVDLGDRLRAGIVVGPRPLGAQLLDQPRRPTGLPPVLGQRLGRRHAGGVQGGELVVAEAEQVAQDLDRCAGRTTAPAAR